MLLTETKFNKLMSDTCAFFIIIKQNIEKIPK